MGKSYEELMIELHDTFYNLDGIISWHAGREGRHEIEAAVKTALGIARDVAAACKELPVSGITEPKVVALKGARIADIHSLVDEAISDGKRAAIFISVTGENGDCNWQAFTRGRQLSTAEVVYIGQGLSRAFLERSPTIMTDNSRPHKEDSDS
ncbi:hypothetical protein LCGC14_1734890 [marine sediment metagenome]|uniref:Uncharacterized protein n=1 Tax=marine sediment metagenome TaxID=412755 RepID=A0A0F9HW24_9ZZZZ